MARSSALLVTRNFPPLVGGMEKLNQKLLEGLALDHEVMLCGPSGSAAFAHMASDALEAPLKPLAAFFVVTAWNAVRVQLRARPRVVVAGSGLTAPMAWVAARLGRAKLVVYLHGLDVIAPSRVYQWVWLPFIRRADRILVNSRNTGSLAESRGVSAHRIRVVHPGTEVPALDGGARQRFRQSFGLGERPLLLSVGRLTRRKGLAEFVGQCLPGILQRRPGTCLLIVGGEASDALHGATGSETERIMAAASQAGVADNIRFVGRLDEASLGDAYQSADLHVFPVLDEPGDVEGFGMVALESAAFGLRTIAFAVGGVPDAVSAPASGSLVPAGDYGAFADRTVELLASPASGRDIEAARAFARSLDWAAFKTRLAALLAE